LPDWLAPAGHYSLHCRQQSCERIAAGDSAEHAPHCKDATRLPDPSTVRWWAQRRLIGVWCWIKAGVKDPHFLQTPTIVAWDLSALCRILPNRGKKSVNRQSLDDLKQQIPLMGYLQAHDWHPVRPLADHSRLVGRRSVLVPGRGPATDRETALSESALA
jgi:hypothetical protein